MQVSTVWEYNKIKEMFLAFVIGNSLTSLSSSLMSLKDLRGSIVFGETNQLFGPTAKLLEYKCIMQINAAVMTNHTLITSHYINTIPDCEHEGRIRKKDYSSLQSVALPFWMCVWKSKGSDYITSILKNLEQSLYFQALKETTHLLGKVHCYTS